jgi:hypothetical protein
MKERLFYTNSFEDIAKNGTEISVCKTVFFSLNLDELDLIVKSHL